MEVSVVTIEKRNFAKTRKGEEAHIYRCVEENGIGFEISDFGATLLGVFVPDKDGNTLQIEYNAYTDKDTLCSITNHTYFNLNGTGNGNVLNHTLTIYSDEFTESNKYCFPNGNILSVEGTPLDFREGKRIGQDILSDYEQVKWYGGYDNNFVIRDYNGDDVPKKVARVVGDKSGIILICESTLPGVQLYTANSIEGTIGKKGYRMNNHDGFCLEAQYFPNAMAHNNFVQPILRAGDKYHHITRYTFTR